MTSLSADSIRNMGFRLLTWYKFGCRKPLYSKDEIMKEVELHYQAESPRNEEHEIKYSVNENGLVKKIFDTDFII